MTPEDIEQLKQLKQLLDDGVLTEEEFALQKSLILAPPQNPELVNSEGQSKQVDGSSTKEQNSRPVEGTQGAPTTRPVSDVDPIREMHIRMNLPKPVTETQPVGLVGLIRQANPRSQATKTATSTSKSVASNTKKLVLTFTAIILVALVVIVSVIAGGSNNNSKEGDTDSTMVVSTDSTMVVRTGNDGDVDMGQVWNWYVLMLKCAVESRKEFPETYEGTGVYYSFFAGARKRVAELIEKSDWPSEVQKEMAQAAALTREKADLESKWSRRSRLYDLDEFRNDDLEYSQIGSKFSMLEMTIANKIGVQRLDSGGPERTYCALLDYYEANPPDSSIFPRATGNYIDGYLRIAAQIRQVCGVVRNLEAPNGNNPDSHLNFINEKAQYLYESIEEDELDGPSDSIYKDLAAWLVQTIDVFMQRNSPAMPLSHMYVVEECERFFW